MEETIRVFVGCGPEHWLPAQVLAHSIRRNTSRPVDVQPLHQWDTLIPKAWRRKVPTSFSLQRFIIPEVCGYQGRGIYLDSDQLVLGDIGEAWDVPFAKGERIHTGGDWQSAVMLIHCKRVTWSIRELCRDMDEGRKVYPKLSNLKYESGVTGNLTENWNFHDRLKSYKRWTHSGQESLPDSVRLFHYTLMKTQPWLFDGHPQGAMWNTALLAAIEDGAITRDQVRDQIAKQNVRPSLSLVIGDDQRETDDAWRTRNRDRKELR